MKKGSGAILSLDFVREKIKYPIIEANYNINSFAYLHGGAMNPNKVSVRGSATLLPTSHKVMVDKPQSSGGHCPDVHKDDLCRWDFVKRKNPTDIRRFLWQTRSARVENFFGFCWGVYLNLARSPNFI